VSRAERQKRETKETQIEVALELDGSREVAVSTSLPFFDHMLTACAFHGGFGLLINATGDIDVDPHHVVEDTGIVMGSCFEQVMRSGGAIARFGHAVIPMDEALSEATIDVCGRPTLVYRTDFPQAYAGTFPLWLFREFFAGFSMGAKCALHLECRYGENAHHMIEALCKAFGRAIGGAFALAGGTDTAAMSTKGAI
jgi:imidazoleglycerol-phosphate dehydratase